MLEVHIISSLLSLIITSMAMFAPSKTILKFSYLSASSVVVSGVLLILSSGKIIRSCITGGIILSLQAGGIFFAKKRLSLSKQEIE